MSVFSAHEMTVLGLMTVEISPFMKLDRVSSATAIMRSTKDLPSLLLRVGIFPRTIFSSICLGR